VTISSMLLLTFACVKILVEVILLDLLITFIIICGFSVLLHTRFTHCKLYYTARYFL
jgi:hypothetical protein